MDSDSKQSRSKRRLLFLLLGVVGLAISAAVFYVYQADKKLSEVKTPVNASLSQPAVQEQSQNGATVVTITDAPYTQTVVAPSPELGSNSASKRRHRYSRNKIASAFPGIPRDIRPDLSKSQRGVVEMWAGDKETFVSVPPGSKFED